MDYQEELERCNRWIREYVKDPEGVRLSNPALYALGIGDWVGEEVLIRLEMGRAINKHDKAA